MGEILVAAGSIIERDGKILLVQETMEEIKGEWNLPIGRLERNEGIIACAKREGKEETGFELNPLYLIGIYQRLFLGRNIVFFIFKSEIIRGKLSIPEDIMDVRWFSLDKIKELNKKGLLIPYILKVLKDDKEGKKIPLSCITVSKDIIVGDQE